MISIDCYWTNVLFYFVEIMSKLLTMSPQVISLHNSLPSLLAGVLSDMTKAFQYCTVQRLSLKQIVHNFEVWKVPIRGSSPPPSTVCRLVGFTGWVKRILVQFAHGKSDQSVGLLPIPLVIAGKSNQSVGVLPIPLMRDGKSDQFLVLYPPLSHLLENECQHFRFWPIMKPYIWK